MQDNRFDILDARSIGKLIGKKKRVAATITSPPYWSLKNYGRKGQIGHGQALQAFLDDLGRVFDQVWDATLERGTLWIVIKSIKKNGRFYPLPFLLSDALTANVERPWYLQDVIIWHKPHSLPWSNPGKLQDRFEYVLCFSKSPKLKLNVDRVRDHEGTGKWWVKYPERHHPLGKSIANVWEIPIPRQGNWGSPGWRHFCPLPSELVERIIQLATKPGDLVLDPFAGSGTTLLAAERCGRRWLGADLNAEFKRAFSRRLKAERTAKPTRRQQTPLKHSNLKLRQLKLALQLYRLLAPAKRLSTYHLPLIVVRSGQPLDSPSPHWVKNTKISLVFHPGRLNGRRPSIERAINLLCKRPPLSLFQVQQEVKLVSSRGLESHLARQFGSRQLYRYTQGHFWNAKESTSKAGAIRRQKTRLPDIVSDIHLLERPAF